MNEFNPVTLSFIFHESIGAWLWLLIALAVALLGGIVFGVMKLRRAHRSPRRPMLMALALGLAAAAGFTFLVPVWSLTGPGALTTTLDYAVAFLFALVPAGILGAAVFILAALRCAGMAKHA